MIGPERATVAALAFAGLTGSSLFAASCGSSPGSRVAQLSSTTTTTGTDFSTTPTGLTPREASLAFSRCMRLHGVPRFPDPDSQGNFPPLDQQALGVSKQTSLAAQEACKHLLSKGGSTGTPQQRQQKLAFGLKVAGCLRTHGYPTFPDPGSSGQQLPPEIDPSSPRFEAAQTGCEKQARKDLGLG
jgi:hypothetical protein